jgi:hypothetical protein
MVDTWNRVLMEQNSSAIGAHMVLMPTDYMPQPGNLHVRRSMKMMVNQGITIDPDPNECQPMWLHPPYESKPSDPWIFSGTRSELAHFPIIF